MIYTDKIHMVADSLFELHEFAKNIKLGKEYFHGVRKGHPHYDLTNEKILNKVLTSGAEVISKKDILKKSKLLATSYHIDDFRTILNWLHNNYGIYSNYDDCFYIGHGAAKKYTWSELIVKLKAEKII